MLTDLLRRMLRFSWRFCRIQKRFPRLEKSIDKIGDDLTQVQDELRAILHDLEPVLQASGLSALSLAAEPANTGRRQDTSRRVLEKLAEAGVDEVRFTWASDGSADVVIDSYPATGRFSRKQAILLDLLQQDWGQITDDKVGWKSPEEISEAMEKRTGESLDYSALTTAINRLRDLLNERFNNRFLIQNHPERGYRFARRRGETGTVIHSLRVSPPRLRPGER